MKKVLTKDNQYQTERIFYRDIASNINERTMTSTLSPKNCYCVNSILNISKNTSLLIAKNEPENFKHLLYLECFEFDKE